MTRLDTKLELPDDLAKQAKEAGLLEPKAMRTTLQEQLKKRAGEKLRAAWARMPRAGQLIDQAEAFVVTIEHEFAEESRDTST